MKTNRVIGADEAPLLCSVAAEISMQIIENAFDYIDSPIQGVGAANFPVPSGVYDHYVLQQVQDNADAVRTALQVEEPLAVKPMVSERLEMAKHAG